MIQKTVARLNGYINQIVISLVAAGIVGLLVLYGTTKAMERDIASICTRMDVVMKEIDRIDTYDNEIRREHQMMKERLVRLEARHGRDQ